MDVDGINPGDDFVNVLDETEKSCSALLAVIGRSWLTIASATGAARLFDPGDFVRREIAAAFAANVHVCPVLVGGAGMPPAEQLPPDLTPLARVQAMVLHDISFQRDADQLIAALDADRHAAFAIRRFCRHLARHRELQLGVDLRGNIQVRIGRRRSAWHRHLRHPAPQPAGGQNRRQQDRFLN